MQPVWTGRGALREARRIVLEIGLTGAVANEILDLARLADTAYRREHPETDRIRYERHAWQRRAWQRRYAATHRDEVRAKNTAYQQRHPDKKRAWQAAYRAAHRFELNEHKREKRRAQREHLNQQGEVVQLGTETPV